MYVIYIYEYICMYGGVGLEFLERKNQKKKKKNVSGKGGNKKKKKKIVRRRFPAAVEAK